jgi:hypothetical protein
MSSARTHIFLVNERRDKAVEERFVELASKYFNVSKLQRTKFPYESEAELVPVTLRLKT